MTEFATLQFVDFPSTVPAPDLDMTYSADGTHPIPVIVDSGLARTVTTRNFPVYTYDLTWTVDQSNQYLLSEWYRTTILSGARPFLLPLLIDGTYRMLKCRALQPLRTRTTGAVSVNTWTVQAIIDFEIDRCASCFEDLTLEARSELCTNINLLIDAFVGVEEAIQSN